MILATDEWGVIVKYAKDFIGGRWPEGERALLDATPTAHNLNYWEMWVQEYIQLFGWPEGEAKLKQHGYNESPRGWGSIGGGKD